MSDYIGGRWAIQEALLQEHTRVSKIFLSSKLRGPAAHEIERLAREKGVTVQRTHERDLDRRVPGAHQGMVAEVFAKPSVGLKDFLVNCATRGHAGPVLLLDGIDDPQNLGAILRSAAFFGASGVIIPRRRSAHPTSLVAKISAGAIEQVPVVQVANIAESVQVLKDNGFWVAGASPEASGGLESLPHAKVALVIGSEGAGLGRLVKERCDFLVGIPGAGKGPASLNASCATAVLLYALSARSKV